MVEGKIRVCLAASAGGHMSQLLRLSESWSGTDAFFVTTGKMVADYLQKDYKVFVVGECNRSQPVRTMRVLAKCIKIIRAEKPDVIISTGAAAGCILCFLGKLRGSRVVWVDSITNVERLSLSGRMVRLIADMFFVQWPHLAEKYTRVEYAGALV
jgi:UDP-N-acetylglucosamine:LPS N-acetylglucosamine transferase